MTTDPFTLTYNAIWSLLTASTEFTALVKPNNRISFAGASRQPEKLAVQDADFPEVRLQPLGGEFGPQRDTSGRTWIERFEIVMSTGDQRVHERLFPVRWAIVRALSNWPTVLPALEWNSQKFARRLELQTTNVGTSQIDMTRGIDGWAAIATIEVYMCFSNSNLTGA